MFTEILLALVVGGVVYFLVQRSKRHQLKSEDGWWGEGTPMAGEEDLSIRPYTVQTDEEELEVRWGIMGLEGRALRELMLMQQSLVEPHAQCSTQDLYRRIDQTRPFPSLEDSQFNYGFNSHYLQKVVTYWRRDFDWRRQVEKLNKFPHYKTNIEGEMVGRD
jgi:microsomal epoxide hydrolase